MTEDKLTPAEKDMLDVIVDYTRETKDTALSVTGWGGPRKGAGRKATGRSKHIYYITDAEDKQLREYLSSLRKPD